MPTPPLLLLRNSQGYFVEPTIFTDMLDESKLFSEEIFGPVLTVYVYDDDNFDDKAAYAICRKMGYNHATEWKSGLIYEIQGYFEITLDDVDCKDAEWGNCNFSEVHNCAHSEDVFLSCSS